MSKHRSTIDPEAFVADLRKRPGVLSVTMGPAMGPLAAPATSEPEKPKRVAKLCEPHFEPSRSGRLVTWTIPLHTVSESNHRDWRERSRRTKEAFAAVKKYMRPLSALFPLIWGLEKKDIVYAKLTRLGGKMLDHGNVSPALKAIEDAITDRLAVDDGSPLWVCRYEQEPGGDYGVRVTLW